MVNIRNLLEEDDSIANDEAIEGELAAMAAS